MTIQLRLSTCAGRKRVSTPVGHANGRKLQGFRVRYSGAKRTVFDGPFAETKELIAGYAIVQVKSRKEMIEWTKRFVKIDAPGRYGAQSECEMRQIFELEDFPVEPAEKPDGWRQTEQRLRDGVGR